MASSEHLSPSLAARPPRLVQQTARQRKGLVGDADLQPLHRGGAAGKRRMHHRQPGQPQPSELARAVPYEYTASKPSPSILGSAEGTMLPSADLAAGLHAQPVGVPRKEYVPECPAAPVSVSSSGALLSEAASIGADEAYSNDERALNEFLHLHPMLSMGTLHHHT